MSLWEALQRWFAGESLAGTEIWGVPVLWIGRSGKLMQFTAGLVVVLDLIGPDRLRNIGNRSQERVAAARLAMSKKPRWEPGVVATALFLLHFPLAIVVLVPLMMFTDVLQDYVRWIEAAPNVMGSLLRGIGVSVSLDVAFWALVALAYWLTKIGFRLLIYHAERITLGPLVYLLDRDTPGHLVRWFAFALFALGFGLDILAS